MSLVLQSNITELQQAKTLPKRGQADRFSSLIDSDIWYTKVSSVFILGIYLQPYTTGQKSKPIAYLDIWLNAIAGLATNGGR